MPNLNYKPKLGDKYCFISDGGVILENEWNNRSWDCHRYSTGNCYITRAAAAMALKMQKAVVKVSRWIEKANSASVHFELCDIGYDDSRVDPNDRLIVRKYVEYAHTIISPCNNLDIAVATIDKFPRELKLIFQYYA